MLLREKRNPQKIPCRQDSPKSIAPSHAINSTTPTWIGAARNMRRRMEATCTNENSMPMVKRSRTIPISANTWTVPMSEMRFNPLGPMSAPATKNPAIEGSLNWWKTKTTAIDAVKITSRLARTP